MVAVWLHETLLMSPQQASRLCTASRRNAAVRARIPAILVGVQVMGAMGGR